jgi:hypothetical protein
MIMKMGLVPTCLLTLTVLLAGCVSYDRSQGVANAWRDPSMPAPVKGRTTQSDIIEMLGPPFPADRLAVPDSVLLPEGAAQRQGRCLSYLQLN